VENMDEVLKVALREGEDIPQIGDTPITGCQVRESGRHAGAPMN